MATKRSIELQMERLSPHARACREYALYDQELMSSRVISKNLYKLEFWKDTGRMLVAIVGDFLVRKRMEEIQFPEEELTQEIPGIDEMAKAYIRDENNRFELNDMILDAIERTMESYDAKEIGEA